MPHKVSLNSEPDKLTLTVERVQIENENYVI